jgi:hypothetical protein
MTIQTMFNNCRVVEVSGPCDICGKEFSRRVPAGVARRTKHKLCDSYKCKMDHAIKMNKLYNEKRRKAVQ